MTERCAFCGSEDVTSGHICPSLNPTTTVPYFPSGTLTSADLLGARKLLAEKPIGTLDDMRKVSPYR